MTFKSSLLVAAMVCASAVALAAGGGDGGGGGGGSGGGGGGGGNDGAGSLRSDDPIVKAARGAIASRDWASAQTMLQEALARNPNNADYHNLFAYSTRKGPNPPMDVVFKHYTEALRINPKHRGAHEYIGEAYLAVNDLPKAKAHLAALDRLCFFSCEEYADLKKAVAEYETSQKR